jgi:Transposase, Mutator family
MAASCPRCSAHLRFPLLHRKVIRSTNLLERLLLEERRRTKIIPHAFGIEPVLKLMHIAVIRTADRWRGVTVVEFEQRQLPRDSQGTRPGSHGTGAPVVPRLRRPSDDPARPGLTAHARPLLWLAFIVGHGHRL